MTLTFFENLGLIGTCFWLSKAGNIKRKWTLGFALPPGPSRWTNNGPKITPYRVNECIIYAVTDMSQPGFPTCGLCSNFVWPVKLTISIYLLNKWIMKPEYNILWLLGSIYSLLLLIWWSLIVEILHKIYKTPLIFALCGQPYNPADRCAVRCWFKLESPVLQDHPEWAVLLMFAYVHVLLKGMIKSILRDFSVHSCAQKDIFQHYVSLGVDLTHQLGNDHPIWCISHCGIFHTRYV